MLTLQPLHVLITTDVVGGVWDFSCVLASELRRGGQRVTLLAFGEPSSAQKVQGEACASSFLWQDLKLEWMQDSVQDVQRARLLTLDLMDRLRPDVVHANQFALGALNLAAPVVVTAHSDVLSWFKWTGAGVPGPEWSTYTATVRGGLLGAAAVVAVSRFLANELLLLYHVRQDVQVIHNGWPGAVEAVPPLAKRPRLSLLAGRAWDAAKNLQLAASALDGWDSGRVVFAGSLRHPDSAVQPVPLPAQWERLGETLGVLPRQQLDAWLQEARVYVSPALYDPFGLLPLQAALAGCPLLLHDIPSYRELWDGAALFFRHNDAADLRRQWRRLLDDERSASALASKAHHRALSHYHAGRMAGEYLELYRSISPRRRAALQPAVAGVR
jgi:glycosyltransferase involved in cell wall biosynthesis